jgi:two-component system, chemotaxis family, chemotaxis protein CheY
MAIDWEKLSVLVIADSVRLRRQVVYILHAHKMKIIFETGIGQEGFSMFCQHSPNLVLADWNTGSMNGIEVTRKIRRDSLSPDRRAPVIVITDKNGGVDRFNEAKHAGVTGLVLKPFSASDLMKHISYAMNDPREFISLPTYAGPDRRRKPLISYDGPFRRATDLRGKPQES